MDGTFTFPELGSESALPHINVSKKFLGAWTSDQRIALRPNCHPNQRNLPVERSMRVTVTIRQHRSAQIRLYVLKGQSFGYHMPNIFGRRRWFCAALYVRSDIGQDELVDGHHGLAYRGSHHDTIMMYGCFSGQTRTTSHNCQSFLWEKCD